MTRADERQVREKNGIEISFVPSEPIARIRFTSPVAIGGAEDAAWVADQLELLVEGHPRFGVLIDCTRIENTDAGWRTTMAERFGGEPRTLYHLAWYNTTPLIRVTVEMFVIAMPTVRGKAFATEDEARAWLREEVLT